MQPRHEGLGTPPDLSVYRPAPESDAIAHRRISRFTLLTVVLPASVVLAASLIFAFTDIDLVVARLAFIPERTTWVGLETQPWHLLYRFGPLPGLILGITCLAMGVVLHVRQERGSVSRAGLFLGLLLAIGPGLIVNVWLKSTWGRPRPLHTTEFGGTCSFVPFGRPGDAPPNSSFPSGHASIGFYLMAPGFLFLRRRRDLALRLLISGACLGAFIGAARVLQGGHFLSDVFWSGVIVYFTGLGLSRLMNADTLEPADLRVLMQLIPRRVAQPAKPAVVPPLSAALQDRPAA